MKVRYKACGASEWYYKDVCDAKLFPMTTLAYPIYCVCFCHLLRTQHCCLCPNGRYNLLLTAHPPLSLIQPPLHATHNVTIAVKRVAQNPAVLAR